MESFRDLTWYKNGARAVNKALIMSNKTAESMLIIRDTETNMFGVGVGNDEPQWCKDSKTHEYLAAIRPTRH